ncbi:hypothetical protein [Aestuariirhabdus sp. LZHN29]|uniref:hypothetical protein n=1 Tax=Aestuariirhabdus sp. LZHN29 TaxID=3417462 RepID=UPI003CE87839
MKRGHGRYQIETDHQLVICRGYGSWNEVTAKAWLDELAATVEQAGLTHWSHYVDASQWNLANPEALPYLQQAVEWAVGHGVQYTLLYTGEGLIKQHLIAQVMTYHGQNRTKLVSSPREAETFLTLQGYRLSRDL